MNGQDDLLTRSIEALASGRDLSLEDDRHGAVVLLQAQAVAVGRLPYGDRLVLPPFLELLDRLPVVVAHPAAGVFARALQERLHIGGRTGQARPARRD